MNDLAFILSRTLLSPAHVLAPVGLIAMLMLASLLHRVRDLFGSSEPKKPVTAPHSDHSTIDRLSDRCTDRARNAPVDPLCVDCFLRETKKLNEASGSAHFEDTLLASMEAVCNVIGAERALIFLSLTGGKELISFMVAGAGSNSSLIIPAEGIAGDILRSGSALVVNEISGGSEFYDALEQRIGCRTFNLLAAPLKDTLGETFGIIQVLNKPGGFNASDQALILPYISALSDSLYTHLNP